MIIIPINLKQANEFVAKYHRHHKAVQGHKLSVGLSVNNELVGIAIMSRPVARHVDYQSTIEVSRLATNGIKNGCSKLYGACARIAKEMGYKTIQTYILEEESGISLKAAGWKLKHKTSGGQWVRSDNKPRRTDQPIMPKLCYVKDL
jgi:hypothetical protein